MHRQLRCTARPATSGERCGRHPGRAVPIVFHTFPSLSLDPMTNGALNQVHVSVITADTQGCSLEDKANKTWEQRDKSCVATSVGGRPSSYGRPRAVQPDDGEMAGNVATTTPKRSVKSSKHGTSTKLTATCIRARNYGNHNVRLRPSV